MSDMTKTASVAQPAENKMGTMPVGKLLINMSLPIIISMLIQALYNIVDSMYVSQIDEAALTAVSLVFPMQNIMISIATGTGVGINALLSRHLGEKDMKGVQKITRHAIFLGIISFVAIAVIMLAVAVPFVSVQSDDPLISSYAITYMRIVCGVSIGLFMQVTFERLLSSTGKTMLIMVSQALGAIINIILDPILIFGYLGLPRMGVAGAAVATVIAQCISAVLSFIFNKKYNTELNMSMKGFRPQGRVIREIYKIGVPSIIVASIGSVMTFGMNMILMQYLHSSTATAVFGVYFKLNSFVFMPVFGLNNGMVPIIAYNYGARHRKRMMQTIKLSVIAAVAMMLIGVVLFLVIPDKLLGLFNASPDMLAIGVPALRIISWSFLFAGYCIVIGSAMQAVGKAVFSMINSMTRQLIILLPAAFILAMIGGIDAVWWSFDIAEIVSVIMTTIFFSKVYRDVIKPIPE